MATGSVITDPSKGSRVRMENHQARGILSPMEALLHADPGQIQDRLAGGDGQNNDDE
jgi:hypothetical protein